MFPAARTRLRHLRESQLGLLAQAEQIDLPQHFPGKWCLEPLWIRQFRGFRIYEGFSLFCLSTVPSELE